MSRSKFLLSSIFITGAAVLAVEVLATRILAAYFGSTIYTVSSVLSVILGALSLGYLLGGRLADRQPSPVTFFRLIILAALALLLINIEVALLLPILSKELGLLLGPLVASILLFTVPGVLLGMLSPLVMALLNQSGSVGQVAGRVFAVSTLGSIFGSLLTGYFLIPTFGLQEIIIGTAAGLLLLGFAGLAYFGGSLKSFWRIGSASLLALAAASAFGPQPLFANVLFEKDGRYETLTVFDRDYGGRPARFLAQDQNSSSAVFQDSDELVFGYTQYAELLPILKPNLQKTLVIGGGAYTVPRYLLGINPTVEVDVSETEPALYNISKQYFRLEDNSRLRNHVVDGRRFLADKSGYYDAIFADAYSSGFTVPQHLMTVEFFRESKAALSPNGIFMANIIGTLKDSDDSYLRSAMKTFQAAYPNSLFIAVDSPASNTLQNIIFIGVNGSTPINPNSLGFAGVGARLPEQQIPMTESTLSRARVFTDNFAPVEYLIARDLRSDR